MPAKKYMDPITPLNAEDLFDILRGIDICVPLRSEGRRQEHCERWSICRWLATMAKNGNLNYKSITILESYTKPENKRK